MAFKPRTFQTFQPSIYINNPINDPSIINGLMSIINSNLGIDEMRKYIRAKNIGYDLKDKEGNTIVHHI